MIVHSLESVVGQQDKQLVLVCGINPIAKLDLGKNKMTGDSPHSYISALLDAVGTGTCAWKRPCIASCVDMADEKVPPLLLLAYFTYACFVEYWGWEIPEQTWRWCPIPRTQHVCGDSMCGDVLEDVPLNVSREVCQHENGTATTDSLDGSDSLHDGPRPMRARGHVVRVFLLWGITTERRIVGSPN